MMNKINWMELRIFFIVSLLFGGLVSNADAEIEVALTSNVAITATITRNEAGANYNSSINPETGALESPLKISYDLSTNSESAEDFDFYISAKLNEEGGGEVDALAPYNTKLMLMLGNNTILPTSSDISNAKSGNYSNNVLAYFTDLQLTGVTEGSHISSDISSSYDNCYLIKAYKDTGVSSANGTIIFTVSGSPVGSTYSLSTIPPGEYRAVITITAHPLR